MATTKNRASIEDIERLNSSERSYELIRGTLVEVPPAGFDHGDVALAVGTELRRFARETRLGRAAGAETGFILSENPAVMLAPDASFVLSERLPQREDRRRFLPLAPDLVVEVVSPIDSASYVQRKVMEYLNFGVRLIWIIDPVEQTVTVYDDNESVRFPGIEDEIDGGDVLQGFSAAISVFFE